MAVSFPTSDRQDELPSSVEEDENSSDCCKKGNRSDMGPIRGELYTLKWVIISTDYQLIAVAIAKNLINHGCGQ